MATRRDGRLVGPFGGYQEAMKHRLQAFRSHSGGWHSRPPV
jgi:hypothetical protein